MLKIRVRFSVKDRVKVGMVYRVRVWFVLSIQWGGGQEEILHVAKTINMQ